MAARGNTRRPAAPCLEGCDRQAKTRGLCGACWARYKRSGREMPPRLRDAAWAGQCGGCSETLPIESFSSSMQRHGGYCRDCMRESGAQRHDGKTAREYHLQRKYGLTSAGVLAMVREQDGCAICHTGRPGKSGWHVDHDHACCATGGGEVLTCGNCVRGILCHHCNLLLGNAKDDVSRLIAAIEYLEDRS